MRRLLPCLLLFAGLGTVGALTAQPQSTLEKAITEKASFEKDVRPILEKFCLGCHSGSKARAGFSLDAFKTQADALKKPKTWEKVAENLRSGTMPPEGKPKPNEAQLDRLNTWVDVEVFKVDCAGKRDPGRVTIHRLNRAEYNNTIRDLVGVDFKPAADFPADDVGYGFDNIGDVLALPPLLLEKYLAAAEKIVDVAWKNKDVREKILNPPPHPTATMEKGMRLVLRTFAERAYRRPVEEGEMRRIANFLEVARRNGESPEFGVKLGITAILDSPHFLFRVEPDDPKQPERRLTDWELATRLSYFLWSSMPDDELFTLARQGKLREPDTLKAQVERMLKDPKSRALIDNFAIQWLTVRSLRSFAPDPKMFPTFNDNLREAMIDETAHFCEYVFRENRSLMELLDSDYTFVNEQLAKHYGIPNVTGKEFRKVTLPDNRRGGVLTMAAVLTVTSNPTRTSPVKRGKWILENILGTPPPPPPPGVEELSQDQKVVAAASLRVRMEQHRVNPSCAICHQRMDPLGFGFENFDAVGAWRTKDGTHDIDPAGVLPTGEKFSGPADLRKILLKRKTDFAKCFTEKVLTYALGRGMERTDRCFIDDIAATLSKNDYKFSTLVLEIVRSDPFQMRRGQRANP
jgi:hypothetical protein